MAIDRETNTLIAGSALIFASQASCTRGTNIIHHAASSHLHLGGVYTSGGSGFRPDITMISIGARWLRFDALAITSCSCKS